MKKILIAAGLTIAMSIGVSANENYVGGELIPGVKKFGKFTDYKSTPELMTSLEKDVPVAYYVINDYFSATNCTNDYMSRVSVEDVNVFAQSEFYGMLIGLVYSMPTYYEVSINGYRFVNCKDKNALQDLGVDMIDWHKRMEELKTTSPETISLELKECDDSLSKENVCFQYTQDLRNEKAKNTRDLFSKSFSQLKLNNECEIKSEVLSDILGDEKGNQIYLKKTSIIQCRTK